MITLTIIIKDDKVDIQNVHEGCNERELVLYGSLYLLLKDAVEELKKDPLDHLINKSYG